MIEVLLTSAPWLVVVFLAGRRAYGRGRLDGHNAGRAEGYADAVRDIQTPAISKPVAFTQRVSYPVMTAPFFISEGKVHALDCDMGEDCTCR